MLERHLKNQETAVLAAPIRPVAGERGEPDVGLTSASRMAAFSRSPKDGEVFGVEVALQDPFFQLVAQRARIGRAGGRRFWPQADRE
jgi:hypothetical protein